MAPKMVYATKSRFELLSEDTGEEEEEEEEVPEVEEVKSIPEKHDAAQTEFDVPAAALSTAPGPNPAASPQPPQPPSTSNKKQAARDRKKASSIVNGSAVKDAASSVSNLVPKPADALSAVKDAQKAVSGALPGAEKVESTVEDVVGSIVSSVQKSLPSKTEEEITRENADDQAKEESNDSQGAGPSSSAASESSSTPHKSLPHQNSQVPSSPRFRPHFQTPVPHPPPGGASELLSQRKRPAPPDFALSTPSPPPKGVKFQDGISAGEGKEGERVIKGVGRAGKGEGHHELQPRSEAAEKADAEKEREEEEERKKKRMNVWERTIWTFIMIFGFIALLCMGHPYVILLTMVCQTLVYKEVTALFSLDDHNGNQAVTVTDGGERGDKWSKALNWYFFVVTNYFLYGESIIYYFKHIVFIDAFLLPFAKNHRFISFMLYIVGFVAFVANLQRQYLRQQFALFCWVHMTLLVIVVSSHFIINNILEGLIWFFIPASLVICNDVWAYICGKMFGRTPLIKLSPKKTVEGFVGAFFCTLLFAVAWGTFFMRFNYMICPAHDLGVNVFSDVRCERNPVFTWREISWPLALESLARSTLGRDLPVLKYAPYQLHLLVMATFASLVAPFGGFFASGFKRAFNIKDFGDSIPGHGGMTDRMDCQFMMGMFAYVYYSSLIRVHHVTPGSVLQTIVTSLTADEQVEVLTDLVRYLDGQGISIKRVLKGR